MLHITGDVLLPRWRLLAAVRRVPEVISSQEISVRFDLRAKRWVILAIVPE
jgi:hypothetical protein